MKVLTLGKNWTEEIFKLCQNKLSFEAVQQLVDKLNIELDKLKAAETEITKKPDLIQLKICITSDKEEANKASMPEKSDCVEKRITKLFDNSTGAFGNIIQLRCFEDFVYGIMLYLPENVQTLETIN